MTAPTISLLDRAGLDRDDAHRHLAHGLAPPHVHLKEPVLCGRETLGEADVETYIKPGKDEISSLSVSFDRMRQSLDHAMQMLQT